MEGYVLFLATFVWVVSFIRLPKMSFPQVNVVQRCNFATLNALAVILIFIMFKLATVVS